MFQQAHRTRKILDIDSDHISHIERVIRDLLLSPWTLKTLYAAMQTSLLLMALYLSLPGGTQAFKPLISGGGSVTHRDITQRAVLRKTAEVCRALAAAQGQDFSLPVS